MGSINVNCFQRHTFDSDGHELGLRSIARHDCFRQNIPLGCRLVLRHRWNLRPGQSLLWDLTRICDAESAPSQRFHRLRTELICCVSTSDIRMTITRQSVVNIVIITLLQQRRSDAIIHPVHTSICYLFSVKSQLLILLIQRIHLCKPRTVHALTTPTTRSPARCRTPWSFRASSFQPTRAPRANRQAHDGPVDPPPGWLTVPTRTTCTSVSYWTASATTATSAPPIRTSVSRWSPTVVALPRKKT